jgi:asparagine synthase (glutamine-hydrolysing)
MQHSVECRMPFLSTGLAEFALSLPKHLASRRGRPKALMQDAFRDSLPREVLKRRKLPFHEGLQLDREVSRSFDDADSMLRRAFGETYPGHKPQSPYRR